MKWLDHLEEALIAFLMGLATLIIFVAVLHRYASGFNTPMQDWLLSINLSWAQEATIPIVGQARLWPGCKFWRR